MKVINTLTGFKWIAAKLRRYEEQLRQKMGPGFDYDATPFAERAKLLQQHSTFYVFGTEESYGYLPNDYLRDISNGDYQAAFDQLCAQEKVDGSPQSLARTVDCRLLVQRLRRHPRSTCASTAVAPRSRPT